MNRLKSFFNIFLFSFLSLGLTGCYDDGLGIYGENGEGEAILNLEAAFSPFAEGNLTRASNVAPKGGWNTISDIAILVFDTEGNLLMDPEKEEPVITQFINLDVEDEKRNDEDASNGSSAEPYTKTVSNLQLKVPFGTYYIIGVANFGEYTSNGITINIKKTSLAKIKEKLGDKFTLNDLRGLKTSWDVNDYANNREMMGFFSLGNSKPHSGSKFETVTVNRPGLKPRAWLRRCASKITVDFDGSQLRDNISIYIKDVKIYDIAKECTLGFGMDDTDATLYDEGSKIFDFNNHPSSDTDITKYSYINLPIDSSLPDDSNEPSEDYLQRIVFGEGDYNKWPVISQKNPYLKEKDGNDLHSHDSECLYFYENMQGTKEGYNRTPVPDLSNGGVVDGYNKKDGIPYGTYIEVTAHYVSEVTGNSDNYEIKYRFMLGKNVTDNFDAERNYHYKLTLKFLGNANEYHWHIDYNQVKGFKVPNPWYVSYLYNHDAYLPFEFSLDENKEVYRMEAQIETNPWYPTTAPTNGDEGAIDNSQQELSDPGYEITPETPYGDEDYPYKGEENVNNKNNWNGFLSLRAPDLSSSVLTGDADKGNWLGYNNDGWKTGKDYYESNQLGERVIIDNCQVTESESNDSEIIKREKISMKRENGNYSISIPLFTRQKMLVKQTGYTGNNPFVGYQRVAKVKLTAYIRDVGSNETDISKMEIEEEKVNVVQVRRVVNPKGVYRSKNNYDPFHVNLKFLSSEREDGEFRSIVSRGPWSAEILGDNNFITINGRQRVEGDSRSEIDFIIRFNRMGGEGNKNAIIRIKYHNYTCTHLIFVRQGYDAQAICAVGTDINGSNSLATEWNTFNMISEKSMAKDPRDEGSLFKYGNYEQPIDASNNAYKVDGQEVYYEIGRKGFIPDGPFAIVDNVDDSGNVTFQKSRLNWTEITSYENDNNIPRKQFKDSNNEIGNAATMSDFEQLYLTPNVEFGYGVLYADGATKTATTIDGAYGWKRGGDNTKGMRGLFVYHWDAAHPENSYNAKNIFFPIGRSGYGHRKDGYKPGRDTEDYMHEGILRYACSRNIPAKEWGTASFQLVAPLFEFLYRRPGAIYWARSAKKTGEYLGWDGNIIPNETTLGMDINYFTFDVNAIESVNVAYGADACFVRTVATTAGE